MSAEKEAGKLIKHCLRNCSTSLNMQMIYTCCVCIKPNVVSNFIIVGLKGFVRFAFVENTGFSREGYWTCWSPGSQ